MSVKCLSAGITYENNGSALSLEIFSKATMGRRYFEGNEAAENGGAIYINIRSQITIHASILRLNKAKNSGGSMLIHFSQAIIQSCTFSNDSAISGYGGAISSENVGNITVNLFACICFI